MRHFLSSLLSSVLLVLVGLPVLANSTEEAEQLASNGHQHLQQGNPGNAIKTWLKALEIYRQEKNKDGETDILINLSIAHQAKGQYPNACWRLTDALNIDNNAICRNISRPTEETATTLQTIKAQPNTLLTLKALQELGITLRIIGNLDESVSVLEMALISAQKQNLSKESNTIRMSLANVQAGIIRQAQNRFALSDDPLTKAQFVTVATSTLPDVSSAYLDVAENEPTLLQARLNWLKMFLSINQWAKQDPNNPELSALRASLIPHLDSTLNQALLADYSTESPIQSIYSRIKLAKYLLEIQQSDLPVTTKQHTLVHAFELANSARNDALNLKNERAESFAIGISGLLYKATKQPDLAQESFMAARALAVSSDSADSAYEWEWELAKVYREQGKIQDAISAYERSIENLDQVRGDLLPIDSELQFRFTDKIQPVYKQYISALLGSETPDIETVVLTNERLQIAQIENFLHCGRLDFVSTTQIKNAPTTIHIVELKNQFEILVPNNGGWARFSVDGGEVKALASRLLLELQDEQFANTNNLLAESRALYQLLLGPIEQQGLLPEQDETIVFVTDGVLSNLPLSILHDGTQYLVERYSIATTLGRLQSLETVSPQQLKLLIAGISKASPSLFAPQVPSGLDVLVDTEEEATLINNSKIKSSTLLNKDFTAEGLRQKLSRDFNILHISTHGQFSSDPNKTFLLAWDKPLTLQNLDATIRQGTQVAANNLELLFLSACQTAKGDQLSSLGIAGMSIQAGAKSTIASLWLVDAESTAQLAGQFYGSLANGTTKAEALRTAQLSLLKQPETSHPYYWAPFFLSGSWL